MATLSETPEFVSGIYQIEQTDPVLGGTPNLATGAGLTNVPAQQLAKRTRWLKDQIDALVADLSALGISDVTGLLAALQQAAPAGTINMVGNSSPPDGWLACEGATVSRTIYSDLYSAIGTTFGAGDGSTTFNLPDLRSEFVRGWDNGRGVDAGRALGSAQLDQFQGHHHEILYKNTGQPGGNLSTALQTQATTGIDENEVRQPITDSVNGAPRHGAETRPRNIALMFIIKY